MTGTVPRLPAEFCFADLPRGDVFGGYCGFAFDRVDFLWWISLLDIGDEPSTEHGQARSGYCQEDQELNPERNARDEQLEEAHEDGANSKKEQKETWYQCFSGEHDKACHHPHPPGNHQPLSFLCGLGFGLTHIVDLAEEHLALFVHAAVGEHNCSGIVQADFEV